PVLDQSLAGRWLRTAARCLDQARLGTGAPGRSRAPWCATLGALCGHRRRGWPAADRGGPHPDGPPGGGVERALVLPVIWATAIGGRGVREDSMRLPRMIRLDASDDSVFE